MINNTNYNYRDDYKFHGTLTGKVSVSPYDFHKALIERLASYWQPSKEVINLFGLMYERLISAGIYMYNTLDVNTIVDNDYINNCIVVDEKEEFFGQLKEYFLKYNYCDCSIEFSKYGLGFIEAVDDEDNPTLFLVRKG